MLRSDMGSQKISEKSDTLEDSSKQGYIKAAASIISDVLFTAYSVFYILLFRITRDRIAVFILSQS